MTTTYNLTNLTNGCTMTKQTGKQVITTLLETKEITTKIIKDSVLAILTFNREKIVFDKQDSDICDLALLDFVFNFLTSEDFEELWTLIDYSSSFTKELIKLLSREVTWYKVA